MRCVWVRCERTAKQLVSDLLCKGPKTGPRGHKHTSERTRPCAHDNHALAYSTRPLSPRFYPTPGCREARIAQQHQLAATTKVARTGRPGAARRPSQRYVWRLKTPTTHPTRHASAQGPCRLRRAPQPAVDPLLGRPVLDLCRESACEICHPTADRKHKLVEADGWFR